MELRHRQGMKVFCEMSREDFLPMCDWYVVREDDGAYLGMRKHPDGDAKVLAVAHLDFLRSGVVHACNRKRIVSSALDDRAGVYIVMELLDAYGIKADVLLTDAEESGDSTIKMLGMGMLDQYNWIIELDRKGEDAVTYGYTELEPFLKEFWNVKHGSASDISKLEEVSPVSAFNLGIGYYQEHSEKCHLSWKVLHRQLKKLKEFYDKYADHKFDRDYVVGEVWDNPKVKKWAAYTSTTYNYDVPNTVFSYNSKCQECGVALHHSSAPDEKGEYTCYLCKRLKVTDKIVAQDRGYTCNRCGVPTWTLYFIPGSKQDVCEECFDTIVDAELGK